jgi:tetratricopeptide (TPR) repeat protein
MGAPGLGGIEKFPGERVRLRTPIARVARMQIFRAARPSLSLFALFCDRIIRSVSQARPTARAGRLGCGIALLLAGILVACGSADRDDLEEIREMQANGQLEESVERLQELVEGGDRRSEVLFRYGVGLSKLGEMGRSVWALDAVIGDPEYAVRAAQELALNAIRGKNFELAIATLERLREERTDGAGDEDIPTKLLEARARLESRRDYDGAMDVIEKILEIDSENEEALRYRVLALLGNRQSEEAYEAIREIADRTTSDDPDADSNRSEEYWCRIESSFHRESGDLDKAEEVVSGCLERFPTELGLIDEAIKVYSIQRKSEEALALLRKAHEAEPENPQLRIPLVRQLRAMQRFADAEVVIRSALEREAGKEFPDSTKLANFWGDLGRFLIDRERLDEGLAAFDEVVSILGDGTRPEFRFERAEALIRVGRYDEALQIAEATPIEVHGSMIRGHVAFERGDFESAHEELESAARIWPNNAPIRYYLARTAEALGDFNQAIEEYRQAIRSDRSLAAARVRLSQLHLAEDRVSQAWSMMAFASPIENALASVESKLVVAEIQARTGAQIDLQNIPTDPKRSADEVLSAVVRTVSRGLRARGGTEATEQWLASLHEKAGGNLKTFLFRERIVNLIESGQIEDAVKRARAEVADHPDDIHAKITLALALREDESSLEEAKTLLVDAVAERPNDSVLLTWLGEVENQSGQAAQALGRFEAALSIEPQSPDAMLGIARALDGLGRRSEAVSRLESFLVHDNPIAGRAALELAMLLEEGAATESRRIEMGLRAFRFGAGQPALELLQSIDPLRFKITEEEPLQES